MTELLSPPINDHAMLEQVFRAEADALAYLESRSDSLFRGQTSRHVTRRWPPKDEQDFPKHTFTLDSIIPSDYRNVLQTGDTFEELVAAGIKKDPVVVLATSTQLAYARAAVCEIALEKRAESEPLLADWMKSLSSPTRFDILVSLGQHVGLPTAYIDLTHCPKVAMWFACHQWSGGRLDSGLGVVYRFDGSKLKSSLERFARQPPPLRDRGVIDISQVPELVSPRPSHQCGHTAYDLYSARVLLDLIARDGVEVVVFDRDGRVNLDTWARIVGPDDPMESAIRATATSPKSRAEWAERFESFCRVADIPVTLDLEKESDRQLILRDLASHHERGAHNRK